MIFTAFGRRALIKAALALTAVGVVGCNSDSGGTAPLPASAGGPPPEPPKEALGANGKPTRSQRAFDSAAGGKAP